MGKKGIKEALSNIGTGFSRIEPVLYPGLCQVLGLRHCFYWQSNDLLTILRVLRNYGKYLYLIACWRCIDDLIEVYIIFVRDGEAACWTLKLYLPWPRRQGCLAIISDCEGSASEMLAFTS